jgi:hypothetical protein
MQGGVLGYGRIVRECNHQIFDLDCFHDFSPLQNLNDNLFGFFDALSARFLQKTRLLTCIPNENGSLNSARLSMPAR